MPFATTAVVSRARVGGGYRVDISIISVNSIVLLPSISSLHSVPRIEGMPDIVCGSRLVLVLPAIPDYSSVPVVLIVMQGVVSVVSLLVRGVTDADAWTWRGEVAIASTRESVVSVFSAGRGVVSVASARGSVVSVFSAGRE